ncbi:subtilisin-like protease SBT4.3 [Setaria italica]|uniref:subtilisin-like protease SBT4.3 n=1 Tax=Setaria italica TaxID=4555 RepID=UPI000BE51538|nr:subtilisin-like protease SBT4.3 [Setaria italica]
MGWLRDRLLLVALFAASLSCAPQTGDGDGAQVIEATPHETIMLVMTDEQVYVVFLGHLPESGSLEYGGPSAVEAAHHDLLSQVLDDGSKIIGARMYGIGPNNSTGLSLLDKGGHRSHTTSIVAGRVVGEVISFSVGNAVPLQYFEDAGAIGSFHAMRRGVLTSATDSNSGLDGGHVCNVAPWMLSFAASGIDPRFVDKIILGNGKTIVVIASVATCEPDGLAGGSYEGKIVLCPADNSGDPNDGAGPFMAGADGAVIVGHYPNLSQALHPGLDIIASWTPLSSPTGEPVDNRKVLYNIESGTSMAWTHASGAAAYVKSHRRDWSPAMIISALITTATPMNTPGNAGSNELKYGAGQLNPSKAPDPGLVYDASERDYVAMLCAQGYNATQLALVNAHVAPGKNFSVGFARTVTNVGASPGAVYVAKVVLHGARSNLAVGVSPDRLEFSKQKRTASFGVSISGEALAADEVVSAAVVWCDGEHEVRSPVVVYTVSAGVHHF